MAWGKTQQGTTHNISKLHRARFEVVATNHPHLLKSAKIDKGSGNRNDKPIFDYNYPKI